MSGIGLSGFLGHNPESEKLGGGGRENWLPSWKDKGEIVVWLHTLAPIVPSFSHPFMEEGEAEDRETGKIKRFLRFPKFVSPDPERVHVNQYFRDRESGVLKIVLEPPPPSGRGVVSIADPFLLLREWLRWEGSRERIPLDQTVFEWTDYKNRNAQIQWRLGTLSGLEERGNDWQQSLDTRQEYLFVVVPDAKPERPLLTRESKLLGDCVRQVIKNEIESKGDEAGDPTQNPYALKWRYDEKERVPMKKYSALRFDRAEYRDEIYELITAEGFPDPREHAKFVRDDMVKMRAAMQAAAQVELPLDLIFSSDPDVRRQVLLGTYPGADGGRRVSSSGSGDAGGGEPRGRREETAGARPPSKPGAPRPAGGARAPRSEAEAESAPRAAPGGRRRMKAPAEPPPKAAPKEETIPCDSCGEPMGPRDPRCPKCGAEYEVDGEPEQQRQEAPREQPKQPPQKAAPAAATKARRPPSAKKEPEPAPEQGGERDAEGADVAPAKCWACGSRNIGKNEKGQIACLDCGVEQSDEVPF